MNECANWQIFYRMVSPQKINVGNVNQEMLSQFYYRKIFLEHFDLKFGHPQVDSCCTCEELDMKIKSTFFNDTAKRVYVAEEMVHLRRAKKFYKKKSKIFQLWQTFFVYHEGIGCLISYAIPENKHFRKCRNAPHLFRWMWRSRYESYCAEIYKLIEQYFPVQGHSFLPKVKRCDRVHTLKEYVELIIISCLKNKFQVRWWSRYYKKCVTFVETSGRGIPRLQKVQLKISQFMHFSHSDDAVVALKFIDGILSDTFRIQSAEQIHLPSTSAYPEGCIPINKQTLEDIRKVK
ncbi:hypothetical protein PR048_023006 [Dryococelus australis]|uniref:Uncharacterized protein n=1 Tax=Dryococelus australis TaxID=614101 RepID=A0ABQ9GSW5_9NEOP|nr:hypothetical protein PR048_023006 [Dryococelus australis]